MEVSIDEMRVNVDMFNLQPAVEQALSPSTTNSSTKDSFPPYLYSPRATWVICTDYHTHFHSHSPSASPASETLAVLSVSAQTSSIINHISYQITKHINQ